jgi:hypothetical protein
MRMNTDLGSDSDSDRHSLSEDKGAKSTGPEGEILSESHPARVQRGESLVQSPLRPVAGLGIIVRVLIHLSVVFHAPRENKSRYTNGTRECKCRLKVRHILSNQFSSFQNVRL